jgi:hypothetical protein
MVPSLILISYSEPVLLSRTVNEEEAPLWVGAVVSDTSALLGVGPSGWWVAPYGEDEPSTGHLDRGAD